MSGLGNTHNNWNQNKSESGELQQVEIPYPPPAVFGDFSSCLDWHLRGSLIEAKNNSKRKIRWWRWKSRCQKPSSFDVFLRLPRLSSFQLVEIVSCIFLSSLWWWDVVCEREAQQEASLRNLGWQWKVSLREFSPISVIRVKWMKIVIIVHACCFMLSYPFLDVKRTHLFVQAAEIFSYQRVKESYLCVTYFTVHAVFSSLEMWSEQQTRQLPWLNYPISWRTTLSNWSVDK